ncbi:MAG: DUF4349 domain-containing protein [Oscillospiraceae bacterium]
MKQKKAFFLPALVLAILLTGCGAVSADGASSPAAAPPSAGEVREELGNFGSDTAASTPDRTSAIPKNAKLIYTAQLEAETTAFDQTAADLTALVARLGGYFQHSSVSTYGSPYRSGNYTVRIPQKSFDGFLQEAGTLCHLLSQSASAEDVGQVYYDTALRLATQKTKLERLQALLEKADTMESIVALETSISDTELAIEQLSGSLRDYDALIDFSTVDISLQEVSQLSNVEQPATGFAARLGAAFVSGFHGLVSGTEGMLLFFAAHWVLTLLLAAAVVLLVRLLKKRLPHSFHWKHRQPPTPPEDGESEGRDGRGL